ncbi:MAG: efflux RND transporter periplasmic adaptor subunit [Acidobacteriota bacterium]
MLIRDSSWALSRLVICAVLLAPGVVLSGCQQGESSASASRGDRRPGLPVKEVRLVQAEELSLARKVTAPGTLAADEQATLSFKVAGRLSQLRVDLGSVVRKGQEVAQLETQDFRVRVEQSEAALQQARARLGLPPQGTDDRIAIEATAVVKQANALLEEARLNLERTKRLVSEGVQSQSELDRVDSAFKVADSRFQDAIEEVRNRQAVLLQRRSELAIARQQLAETTLFTPFEGAIRERRATVGEYLVAGTPVTTIVRLHPLRLRVEIPERDAQALHVGQAVRVTVEGDPEVFAGRVARLSPAFVEQSRTLVVEAEVDNQRGRLRPGSFAKAEIETSTKLSVVMVPTSSVVTFAGIQKIFLIKDSNAVERSVVVGRGQGDLVEIVEGVKAGEMVIAVPGNLVGGQPVKVLN